jgi:hypothetical protein
MIRAGRRVALTTTLLTGALFAIACGGTGESVFVGRGDGEGDRTVKGPDGELADDATAIGPKSTTDACVTSTANAALQKVNLVFMYDRSGSMGDTQNDPPFDPNLKWIPVGEGMKSFFADKNSQTLSASLQFFPLGTDVESNCKASYATPKVALSPLVDSSPFVGAITSTQPRGGTPTLPALQGAIQYAKQVAQQRPEEKPAVVLVTDGEPGFNIDGSFQPGCADNDVSHVAAAAAAALAATPSIPTYVIGVGPSLNNLNKIASSGGTKQALMVAVADPTKTAASFQSALDQIRGQLLSCDFSLPPPPAGKQLDVEAVNVALTNGGGETILGYSNDCSNGQAWHYDNATAPTRIQLCPAACDSARQDATAKLTIAFGCRTNGIVR